MEKQPENKAKLTKEQVMEQIENLVHENDLSMFLGLQYKEEGEYFSPLL